MKNKISMKALQHLINIDAPMEKIELQGKYIGFETGHFPRIKGNAFTTGDVAVMKGNTKWICIFDKLYKSPFSDRYIAFYMTYEDCLEYGIIFVESANTAQFNFEYKSRLHAAKTTEDYVSLLEWIYTESFGKQNVFKTYEKYEEIALLNIESLAIHMEKVNPIEEYCIHRILTRLTRPSATVKCY